MPRLVADVYEMTGWTATAVGSTPKFRLSHLIFPNFKSEQCDRAKELPPVNPGENAAILQASEYAEMYIVAKENLLFP
jgi:hypothetical protein